jgi:hypothetical protein
LAGTRGSGARAAHDRSEAFNCTRLSVPFAGLHRVFVFCDPVFVQVLAESEAAKQRREAEIEAVMATQPPIFVFNEELLRKVTEQSQEPVPASGPEPEAKVEVAVASEPQASAGKVEFVPPPPLPSRRERKIAQDSESDDSDVEVAVTSKALDHYRATTRTSRLPPLPPSPMKTAQDGLEGGAIESKSLYDDGDDDNTTPSGEAQKQRIAATVLSDKVLIAVVFVSWWCILLSISCVTLSAGAWNTTVRAKRIILACLSPRAASLCV